MSLNEPKPEPAIAGIILCGGYSQRMGQDKALLRIGDHSFVQHLAATLQSICHPVVLVGRADQQKTFADDFPFFVDLIADAGPLAGLVTGLETVRDQADLALVVACDTPLIQPALVHLLAQSIADSDAAIPWDGERPFGLTAVYRTSAATPLRQMLDRGQRRVQDIGQNIRITRIGEEEIRQADPQLDSLRGCNTPEEYRLLTTRYQQLLSANS